VEKAMPAPFGSFDIEVHGDAADPGRCRTQKEPRQALCRDEPVIHAGACRGRKAISFWYRNALISLIYGKRCRLHGWDAMPKGHREARR
jgi:hypothetical protein